MAFMGIFLLNLIIALLIIGTATTIAIVLFVIAAVLKKRQMIIKKNAEAAGDYNYKVKKTYLILRILGCIFSVPFVACAGLIMYAVIAEAVEVHTSLSYSVFHGDTAKAEKILKRGVTPDCTEDSNRHAKNGQETLLYNLIADDYDKWANSSSESEEEKYEKKMEMINLLLEYGADVNYVTYYEEKNNAKHGYEDEYSIYKSSDQCGWTPLMIATYTADFDLIKLLVDNGADVNAVDYCGYNVIDIVADNLNDEKGYDILEYYLEKGVDPNHVTNFNQDALWLAYRQTTGSSQINNDKILSELKKLSNKTDE